MKSLNLPFLMLIGLLVGCTTKTNLLEGTGKIVSQSGNWKIKLLDNELRVTALNRTRIIGLNKGVTVSPNPGEWETHPGAFAYIDEKDRAWVYDGESTVEIYEQPDPGSIRWHTLSTWTNDIPKFIIDRIEDVPNQRSGPSLSKRINEK